MVQGVTRIRVPQPPAPPEAVPPSAATTASGG